MSMPVQAMEKHRMGNRAHNRDRSEFLLDYSNECLFCTVVSNNSLVPPSLYTYNEFTVLDLPRVSLLRPSFVKRYFCSIIGAFLNFIKFDEDCKVLAILIFLFLPRYLVERTLN